MIEPIESDDWVELGVDLPPALIQRVCAEAARHGRTPSEQFVYDFLRAEGLIRPSLTQ